jgi:hypothetical protein
MKDLRRCKGEYNSFYQYVFPAAKKERENSLFYKNVFPLFFFFIGIIQPSGTLT